MCRLADVAQGDPKSTFGTLSVDGYLVCRIVLEILVSRYSMAGNTF